MIPSTEGKVNKVKKGVELPYAEAAQQSAIERQPRGDGVLSMPKNLFSLNQFSFMV